MSLEIPARGAPYVGVLADFGGAPYGKRARMTGGDGIVYEYVLAKAAGTIPLHALCKKHTTSDTLDVVVTQAVGSVADRAIGINDTGTILASGDVFWMLQGPKYVVLDAGGGIATVGEGVGLHATTDGEADTLAATAGHQCIGVCTIATSGGLATVYGWLGR